MKVRWTRIAVFFVVTVLATQGFSALVGAVRGPVRKGDMVEWLLRANLAMLVPGIVALVFAHFVLREPAGVALDLRWRPNWAWLVAWLLPAVMTAVALGILLLAPGAHLVNQTGPWSIVPLPLPWSALLLGLLAGTTVGLPGAFAEELAWRGLLRRELAALGFWPASLIIGLLWAGWHLPAVIFGGLAGGTATGALGLSLRLVLGTPIAIALCQRGRSVVPAALMHASGSGMMVAVMAVKGGQGLLAVLAPVIPLVVALVVLLAFPALRRDREADS
jgi:hypothetical protein